MAYARPSRQFRIEGLSELDEVLKELPKATARAVLKRTLIKAGEPIAEAARALAPVGQTGNLNKNIIVSAKIKNRVGNAEYADAIAQGLGKAAAVQALRDARRAAAGSGSNVEVYIGPTVLAFYGMFQEFGTSHNAARPFLRPAFDRFARTTLGLISDELAKQIEETRKRIAKRAERLAAKLKAGL